MPGPRTQSHAQSRTRSRTGKRTCGCGSDRVQLAGCLVTAAVGHSPGHDAGLVLGQLPAGRLLGLMMPAAQWHQVAITTLDGALGQSQSLDLRWPAAPSYSSGAYGPRRRIDAQRLYALTGCLSDRSQSQSTGPYQSTGTPRTRCGSSPCLACGPISRRGIPKTLSGSSRSPDTRQPFAAASHRPDSRLGVRSNKHDVAAWSRQGQVAHCRPCH